MNGELLSVSIDIKLMVGGLIGLCNLGKFSSLLLLLDDGHCLYFTHWPYDQTFFATSPMFQILRFVIGTGRIAFEKLIRSSKVYI